MNTNKITFYVLSFSIVCFVYSVYAETVVETTPSVQKRNWSAKRKKEMVTLNYVDEELIDIINQLAAEKGVNIVLPVGEDSIEERVTLQMEDMSFEQAWDLLYVILEIAGYSMISKGDLYTIVKTSPEIVTQPLPLYVGTPADELPNIDEQVRYIYFLTNLKIGEAEKNEITDILNVILPGNASILTNQNTNSIIITDTARNIKSAMKIVHALDQTELKEDYEVIPLRYISAESVASIFNAILGEERQPHRYRLDTRKKSEVSYFSRHIKIIAEPRTNSLLLLGRRQAIERVQNFIYQYIDVELDSGNSVLHVYQLQYLDAQEFAKTLQTIVSSGIESPTGQAQATGKTDTVERFFEGVIVRADTATEEEPSLDEEGLGEYKYYGGNKIIVAAKQEDWIRIRKLIEQLDTPQPQVIIEVLIADLTLRDTRAIASIIRNPIEMAFPKDVDFQSAQASAAITATLTRDAQVSGIITDNSTNPTTIQADLLRTGVFTNPDGETSIASGFPAGTTLASFNDRNTGQTWGLLELRQLFDSDKILSNPHVIATNNQRAEIIIGERRLLPDQASGSEGGTTQVAKKWIDANLVLTITPRISSADTVNLNVEIKIDRFQDPAAGDFGSSTDPNGQIRNNIDNRWVYTNANVHDQDILALGGLTRVDLEKTITQWPLLGRVPLLGYFFKDRNNENRKTNLSIFISPTIVQPRLRGGTSEYTQAYINKSKEILTEGYLFESLQDPITRFFFGEDRTSNPIDEIDRFVSKDEFTQPSAEQFEDIRALAVVNLDTTKDDAEEKEKICCSRQERMKKLVQQESNPLTQTQTSFNNESNKESSTRSK